MHFRHFPVAMGRFFHWAFEELGHEVFTIGPYSGGRIPWGDKYFYPEHKYPPNYVIPEGNVNLESVRTSIPFKPDFIFQAADVIYLSGPSAVPNVILATDPHAVDYTTRLQYADYFFCMQNHYMKDFPFKGPKAWIPYAHDPNIHKRIVFTEPVYDIVFSGLQYDHRKTAMSAFQSAGLKVFNTLGLIYDDYVNLYNKGKIAFNWSSKQDLPARFWEGLAMGRLVLTNRVPDLKLLDLTENKDYVAFDTLEEAVVKAKYYLSHETERVKIASSGYGKVQKHTYQNRCLDILKVMKLL